MTAHAIKRGQGGFIVVAVLWILAALGVLVLVYVGYVSSTAVTVAATADRAQRDALTSAGVELAAYQLASADIANRPTSGTFDARLGTARIAVTFRSEAARIDLNLASGEMIAGLFTGLGAKPDAAATYAARIIGWRAPAAGPNDEETAFYRMSGVPYPPRHAPFAQNEELWLVQGIPAALVERALPFVTVFSNSATVNAMDAAPQVLAALPGMTPERLQAITARRDPQALASLSGGPASLTSAYRVTVRAALENGRSVGAEVVILLMEDGDDPYRVLSWRNAFDGEAGARQAAMR